MYVLVSQYRLGNNEKNNNNNNNEKRQSAGHIIFHDEDLRLHLT